MHNLVVRTLFEHDMNSGGYSANGVDFSSLPEAQTVYIPQAEADSVDAGTFTLGQRTIELHVRILDFANRYTREETLRRWCKPGTSGQLVAGLDDGVDYQLDCRVTSIHRSADDQDVWIVMLLSGNTNWRAVDPDVFTTWSPSGAGGTHDITVAGTDVTRLNVILTATAAPAGVWLYQDLAQIINVPGVAIGLKVFFITLDTATLIADGKLQDNCNDLRLFDGGVQIPRRIYAPNTSATLVVFVLNMAAGAALTLSTGTLQVETATAVGTIGTAGDAKVTVTAAGMTGSPKIISVAVAHNDTATVWAGKVRAALRLDADVSALYDVGGIGQKISLIRKSPAANDSTLNMALDNDTCTGISPALTSTNTRTGVLYSVPGSGTVSTLRFDVTTANKSAIKGLPAQFTVRHGTEWFVVKKSTSSEANCILLVLKRGAMGTAEQQHDGGDVFYYIQHPVVVYYGNETAPDPSTAAGYNNTQGVFDLGASDNTKAVYSATSLFYDPTHPNRPGTWSQLISRKNANSYTYAFQGNAASGSPAIGAKAAAYLNGATWTADIVVVGWMLTDPRGIRRVTVTGRKYRTGTYWPVVKMQCSNDNGAHWQDIFTETTPGSAGAWVSLASHTNIDIDNTCTMVRMVIIGLSDKDKDSYAAVEGLTVTVYWTTANIPSITLLGETSNYHLDVRVTNSGVVDGNAVSDSIEWLIPMQLDTPLTLDCETFSLTYDDQNYHSAMSLDDEGRGVPLRAWPGLNTISIESVSGDDIGTLEIDPSVYRRRL